MRYIIYVLAVAGAFKLFGHAGFWPLMGALYVVEYTFNPAKHAPIVAAVEQPGHPLDNSVKISQG